MRSTTSHRTSPTTPAAKARFAEIGGQNIPAIAKAGACIPGADLDRVAEFLDLVVEPREALPVESADRTLVGCSRDQRPGSPSQFSVEHLADKLPKPGPNRAGVGEPHRGNRRGLPAGGIRTPLRCHSGRSHPRAGNSTPRDLATRSRSVRARLAALRPAPTLEVETLHGVSNRHRVLERCTWHAAQHARQLAFMLERLGVEPDRPLTSTDLEGLPLPVSVWDDETP